MKTLIAGVGALGGLLAARLLHSGCRVSLATRSGASARQLNTSGLRAGGVGGDVTVPAPDVAAFDTYSSADRFELIVLATKAHDALAIAPRLATCLAPGGVLLPIQNGAVGVLLAESLGAPVLGGLSNLGATMVQPGVYEQRSDGHLLVGEIAGGESERATRVREWLSQGLRTRSTTNLRGAVWSKLLLNCAVTTLGAVGGGTMRSCLAYDGGRALFEGAYAEALRVGLATGTRLETMIVDPIPPATGYETWFTRVLDAYGDVKPSMLQDFERGRPTEIDFINGYVVTLGERLGIPTPLNAALTDTVRAITRGETRPGPENVTRIASPRA